MDFWGRSSGVLAQGYECVDRVEPADERGIVVWATEEQHVVAHEIPHPMAIGDQLSIVENLGTTIATVTQCCR